MNLKRLALQQIFILFFSVFFTSNLSAQLADIAVSDSLKLLPVELSKIPIRSAETLVHCRTIREKLYSAQKIEQIKHSNDSILDIIDEENKAFFQKQVDLKSIRYYENQKLQLKNQQQIVEVEKNKMSKILGELEKSIKYLQVEQTVWRRTKTEITKSGFSGIVIERIDLILKDLENTFAALSQQGEVMLSILDRSAEISIEMDELVNGLDDSIRQLEEQILQNNYPSIFKLEYSAANLKFKGAFKNYSISEWTELKSYLSDKINEVLLTLLVFALWMYLFVHFRSLFNNFKLNESDYYKKHLGIILSTPWSASLVLTLLTTLFIFPYSPPAFRDVIAYMYVIPIVIIMKQLLDKKLLFFVYGFAAIMFLNIVFLMLPPENIIYRYTLLFISVAEIYLTSYFLFRTIKRLHFSQKAISIFRLVGYAFFIMAVLGLFASISGNVRLAQKELLAVNYTVIVGAILYATVVIINGLFISLLESNTMAKVNFIILHGDFLKKRIITIFNSLAIVYTIYFLLKKLSLWNTIKDGVLALFNYGWNVGNINFSLGTIFLFFLVIYISATLGKILQIVLEGDVLHRMPLKKGIPHTISMLVKYSLIAIGVFLAVSATGIETSSLTVIIGAFGVGIGFGLQNIFNNLVSGLILLFERPVQLGDTIEVGTLIGQVNSIGIRSSNIKTFDGAEVIVPNGQFISNEVINWTLSDQQRRIEVIIGVSYNSDPHVVYDLLMKIMEDHKEIMNDPKPVVFFNELGESSLNFRMLFWTTFYTEWLRIRSEIIFSAFDRLKENNIEIPFPQRDLHIKTIHEHLKADHVKDEKQELD